MDETVEFEFGDNRSEIVALYQYEPLPTLEHTRVLVVPPGPDHDREYPLVASLELLDLGDADSEAFKFEAISYVWGSSETTDFILVDGQLLWVTASLRGALLQARLFDRPRRLWADGVCINQSDKNEKGHQVSAMGRIYKTSQRTLICLGNQDPEHAQHAAGLVERVNLMIQNVQRDLNFSGEPDSFPFPSKNDTIVHDSRWELGWNAMLSHPWFERGWVVQEASLAPDACVLWASEQMRWSSILRVDFWVYNRGYSTIQSQGREIPESLVEHHYCSFARRHPKEARSFGEVPLDSWTSTLSTLLNAQQLELSDPRDRIYAFMALDTSDRILEGLQLDPDYNRPFQEIYHEFAVKYLEKTGDLDILSSIAHSKESLAGPAVAVAIPSWVPRWDQRRNGFRHYEAKMVDHPKTIILREQSSVLQVRGLILGSVEYSATQEPCCPPDLKDLTLQKVISLWSEIVAATLVKGGPYDGRQAFAFLGVLCPDQAFGTFEEWSTGREHFARHLQSCMPGPERNSADSIAQSSGLVTEQHSVKIFAEEIRAGGFRRFVILSRGYYGAAPRITQKGDVFALIYGTESLSILRPVAGKPDYYQVVGPVYVESKTVLYSHESNMLGEEGCRDWEEWGLTEQDINLC